MRSINLGLAFVLELCLLGALVFFGFQLHTNVGTKIVAGVGLPLLLAVVWGVLLAPRATHRLVMPWLLVAKLVLFGCGTLALYLTSQTALAAIFGVAVGINFVLAAMWHQA